MREEIIRKDNKKRQITKSVKRMGQTNSTSRPTSTKKNLISNNNNITADSNIITTKNANKKLYKRHSTVYPSATEYINSGKKQTIVDAPAISATTSTNQQEFKIAIIDCQPIEVPENGAIDLTIPSTLPEDGDVSVVYRNRNTTGPELKVQKPLQTSTSDVELRMTTAIVKVTKTKEKKKKKEKEIAVESGNTYHKTNSCYYKLENGTFFKFPSNTFHKSNDGCYTKLSNGSFRHLLFKNKEMQGFGDGEEMNAGSGGNISQPAPTKHSRASMPANATTKLHNDAKTPATSGANHHVTTTTALQQNRKVMVTMIDGGLPVVAVSKPNKTNSNTKKDKNKVIKDFFISIQLRFVLRSSDFLPQRLKDLPGYFIKDSIHSYLVSLVDRLPTLAFLSHFHLFFSCFFLIEEKEGKSSSQMCVVFLYIKCFSYNSAIDW